QEEALSMADRIAVMARGRIEQVSSPTEIYDKPATLFVNQFVGTTNVLRGEFAKDGDAARVTLPGATLDVPAQSSFVNGTKVAVSIRPEHLRVVPSGGLAGTVKAVLPLGSHVVYDIEIAPGVSLKMSEPREGNAVRQSGERVNVAPTSPAACRIYSSIMTGRGEQP
ncbi:MAG TPA: TOBE domain-containing protein, partial [Xanthobacteraceae bacterium]|nr:TOBE domain-containing protein [Xanthobacteraceae bacterium]